MFAPIGVQSNICATGLVRLSVAPSSDSTQLLICLKGLKDWRYRLTAPEGGCDARRRSKCHETAEGVKTICREHSVHAH